MELTNLLHLVVRPRLHARFEGLVHPEPMNDPSEDADSQDLGSSDEEISVSGVAIIIEYEDSRGTRSQRLISCKKLVLKAGIQYLHAFCHHRERLRTFRVDRIVDIFEPETGVSLGSVQSYFAQYTFGEITSSGLGWGLSVRSRADLIAFLNALIFVARCDEEYHPLERGCLETVLVGFWLRLELPGEPDCESILSYADKLAPDGEIFWVAMHRIRKIPELVPHFKRSCGDMIRSDGIIHQRESYWGIEIEQFFRD